MRRILGWTEEEFGTRGRALMHPDDLARVDPREVFDAPGVAKHTKYRMQHRDGSWRWMSVTAINLLAHPTIAGIVAHHHDITDLENAAEALRRSQQELAATLDSIGDGVIATDARGLVTRMNAVAERLTGWRLVEAKGRELATVFEIVDETTRDPVESPVVQVLREGGVVGLANHTVLISRDRTERAIADSGAPIRDSQGNLHGVVLVFRDLTDERNAERALARSEARFRALRESGIIGIISADLAGNISETNDAFLSMLGYTRDDFRAGLVSGATLNTPERDRTDAAARAELATSGIAHAWEKELLKKNGTRLPILCGVVLLDKVAGESLAFVLDVSERKRIEAALRESEARRSAVMEAALDAIVMMDHEGTITDFNPAAERTFGYERHEVIGRSLASVLVPVALRTRHVEGLQRYLASGEEKLLGKRIEVPALRKGGEAFPAEVAVVRIRSAGRPIFTGYIRDITDRKQAAQAEVLRSAKEAAEDANAELEAFSYAVAHDLRAPLRALSGFSKILIEDHRGGLDAEALGCLDRISSAADRMGQMIDALLGLARYASAEPRREIVDLGPIASGVVERLRAHERDRDVELVVADDLTVRGDARLLTVLLENLLGNAWKFTRGQAHPRIEVGKTARSGDAVYWVRDNGAGFDSKEARSLSQPFRRFHSSAEFEGTGIGLATVKRVVRRHGGTVWAEAAVGEGATFFFTLPDDSRPRD